MRFIVFGAGAVGGVVGGRLAEAGSDVLLVARGAHADAIRTSGLTVRSPERTITVEVPVVTSASEISVTEDDIVLLSVKSQHSGEALSSLRAVCSPSNPIVCLQNGVENERAALRLFDRVYGVCVMCLTGHLVPGVVDASSSPVSGLLDVGRYPRGSDEVTEAIAAAFNRATFSSLARPDIMRWKYAKLLMNLGNAVEALCGPKARRSPLVAMARAEGVACLRAAGIDFASEEEDMARRGDLLQMGEIEGERRGGGSTWQSLQRQTGSIETDFLNGEIAMLGRRYGVPAPVNSLLQKTAAEVAASRRSPGSMTAEQLMERLEPQSEGV